MIWKYPKDVQSIVEEFIFYSVSCSSTSTWVSRAGYWLMLTCIGKTSPGSVRGKSVNVLPPFISVLRRGIEIDPSWPWQPRCKRESPKKALYQLEVPPNHDPVNQRVVLFTFTWEDYCRVPSKETEFILSTAKWFCPCVYQLRIMVIQCFFTFWNCRGHLEQSFMSQVCGGFAGPFLSASR